MKLSRQCLEAMKDVTAACSTEQMRPILTGVELVSDGTTIRCQATDSYIAARRTLVVDCDVFNVIVDGKGLAAAAKTALGANKYQYEYEVVVTEASLTITHAAGSAVVALIEGRFPDLDSFVKDHKAGEFASIAIDPYKLVQLAKALGHGKAEKGTGTTLEFRGDGNRPAMVTFTKELDRAGNFGLIMPIRTN
jgi:DNA polymerase III sliding clamp (beta) subunit (PCNA family)